MTRQTLIESLIRQTDKNFSLIICNSAMDPLYTYRLLSFDAIGVPWYLEGELDLEVPRRHIEVSDDVYLAPRFIEMLKVHDEKQNIRFDLKTGFIFQDGISRRWTASRQHIKAEQIAHGDVITKELPWQWVLPIHQMNDDMKGNSGEEVVFACDGWRPGLVSKLAKLKIVTGSAMGCDLHPTRSSSIIKGYKHYQNRGKVNRGRTVNKNGKEVVLSFPAEEDPFRRTRGNRLRRRVKKNAK